MSQDNQHGTPSKRKRRLRHADSGAGNGRSGCQEVRPAPRGRGVRRRGPEPGQPGRRDLPAGAPDLSQFGAEDQDSAGEPGAGRFGGTEEQYEGRKRRAPTPASRTVAGPRDGACRGEDVQCRPRRPKWTSPTPRIRTPGGRSPRNRARKRRACRTAAARTCRTASPPGTRRRDVRRRLSRAAPLALCRGIAAHAAGRRRAALHPGSRGTGLPAAL